MNSGGNIGTEVSLLSFIVVYWHCRNGDWYLLIFLVITRSNRNLHATNVGRNVKKFTALIWLTTLEQRQHSKLAPARSTAENTARVHKSPPKEKQAIFEQIEEFQVSTGQNPHFLPGTLYFGTFYLKHFTKIFLLTRFEKILNTHSSWKSIVSG